MGSNGARGGGSNRYEPPKKKNIIQKAAELYMKASPVVNIIKGISTGIKNEKNLREQKKVDALGGEMLTREKKIFKGSGDGPSNINNNNSNVIVPLINATTSAAAIAPTIAEVSQSSATDATDTTLVEDIALKKKKTKATGRSMTILTSSKGVTSNEGLTLGKKSLLGS
jgi:hypothetical protein